jgi:tripartite ATP-independent transporter DctM subunit
MLIPPSVLMIVWGVLTEIAIGKLFIAGIIPGLMVVGLYIAYILWVAYTQPHRVGEGSAAGGALAANDLASPAQPELPETDLRTILWSTAGIIALVLLVLGGIWFGFFTPTEGAGVGATLALLLAVLRGMKPPEMVQAIISVGRTSAPLLILLVTAQLYSRVLSMTGITGMAKDFFLQSGLSPYAVLALMILVWFLLGAIIDSISIILLTVPVFAPIAAALGFDPIAFAIIGILAIETGLLTPPFGILVFTVKSAVPDEPGLKNGEIFRGAVPYWICLLGAIGAIVAFPEIATWLPTLGDAVPK